MHSSSTSANQQRAVILRPPLPFFASLAAAAACAFSRALRSAFVSTSSPSSCNPSPKT